MIWPAILIFCLFFCFNYSKTVTSKTPYIYSSSCENVNKIELFLTLDCNFCYQALEQLANYLSSYLSSLPKIDVRIYFFATKKGDEEKILYILAAENNIGYIIKLMQLFKKEPNLKKNKLFQEFLTQHPEINENLEKNIKTYKQYIKYIQKKFEQMNISYAPAWVVNNENYIYGAIENLPAILEPLIK